MTDDLDDALDRRVFLAAIGASAALAANTGAGVPKGPPMLVTQPPRHKERSIPAM